MSTSRPASIPTGLAAACGVLFLGAASPAMLPAQRNRGPVSDSARVHGIAIGIIAADNDRALKRILAYYAPDAMLLPPGEPPVTGREIRARYERLFAAYDPAIETTLDEIVVGGDLAYVRGRNRGRLLSRTGQAHRSLSDIYVMILRRGPNGAWNISRLMWHPIDGAVSN